MNYMLCQHSSDDHHRVPKLRSANMQDLTQTAVAVSDLEEAEYPISEAVEEVRQDMPQPDQAPHEVAPAQINSALEPPHQPSAMGAQPSMPSGARPVAPPLQVNSCQRHYNQDRDPGMTLYVRPVLEPHTASMPGFVHGSVGVTKLSAHLPFPLYCA